MEFTKKLGFTNREKMNRIKLKVICNYKSIDFSIFLMKKGSILSRRGFSLPKTSLTTDELKKHKRNLTIMPFVERKEYSFGIKPIPIYKETDKRFYMPRFYGLKQFGQPENDKLTKGGGENIETIKHVNCKITLRDYQVPIVQDLVLPHLKKNFGGLLSLWCGYGKTLSAIWISKQLNLKTIIVCHTTSLMQQWAKEIRKWMPNARIGIIQQDKCEVEDKDFIIASLKTIALKTYDKNQFDSVGFVVWDEIHLMCTNLFSKAFPKLCSKYSLGLSATPQRKDKLDVIFHHYIGPVIYSAKRKPNDKLIVESTTIIPKLPIETEYDWRHKIKYTTMVTKLCYSQERTRLIATLITQNALIGRKILVLSEYIKHLKMLQSFLKINIEKDRKKRKPGLIEAVAIKKLSLHSSSLFYKLPNEIIFKIICYLPLPPPQFTVGLYIGEMKMNDREISQKCDVILGTYKLASVGMDIPDLNTLVMASPRKEIEQSVGRILRKEGKLNPLIIDIIDDHGIFISQSRVRKKFYKKYGYQIQNIKMKWDGTILSIRHAGGNPSAKKKMKQEKQNTISKYLIREDSDSE